MSAPAAGTPSRETPMGVLGLLVGFVVLAVAFAVQWPAPVQPVEARPLLEQGFQRVDLPDGWSLSGAERLPDRRVLVQLVREGAPEAAAHEPSEAEAAALAKLPGGGAGGAGGGPPGGFGPKPWPLLEELPEGPARAGLLEGHGAGPGGVRARKAAFTGLEYQELDKVDSKGEAALLDAGRKAWGPYEVPWVLVRHFRKDGERPTFHDTVRVDLTSGREAWLLHLAFPERVRGSAAALDPFLAALQPMPPEPPQAEGVEGSPARADG